MSHKYCYFLEQKKIRPKKLNYLAIIYESVASGSIKATSLGSRVHEDFGCYLGHIDHNNATI